MAMTRAKAAVVLLVVVLGNFFPLLPLLPLLPTAPTAQAQLATIETNASLYFPAFSSALGIQTNQIVSQSILTSMFNLVKKRIFDMMTDQIIDYINGNGKPQFITDWRGFFDTVGQAAVGDVVRRLGLSALCSPFKLQVQLAMIAPPRFSKQITCTLGQIVRNVQNFYLDFRSGGWLAYQELWAPNNNFYGSLLLAWNAKENEVAARLNAAGNEALAGRGFLSVKKCLKDRLGRDIPGTCVITTPGTTIGALTQKVVGSDLDYIINSQDLAVYVSAISDAFINRLIRSGVSGLTGVPLPNRPPQNVFSGVGCDAFFGRAKDDCLKYQNQYRNTYQLPAKASLEQINAALTLRQQAQAMLQNLINQETTVIAQLNTLLACQFSKNRDTAETRTLLTHYQQQLERHIEAQQENNYVIDQLTAATKISNGYYLPTNQVSVETASAFLTEQTADQVVQQPTLTDLSPALAARINQCQGQ